MSMRSRHLAAGLLAGFVLIAGQAFAARQWHFVVKNKTDSAIVKLQVSPTKSNWGDFDIGNGIKPGEKATLVWDESTNNEPCEEYIRAKFADGTTSPPSKQNFCEDLDTPIEFSEDDD